MITVNALALGVFVGLIIGVICTIIFFAVIGGKKK